MLEKQESLAIFQLLEKKRHHSNFSVSLVLFSHIYNILSAYPSYFIHFFLEHKTIVMYRGWFIRISDKAIK